MHAALASPRWYAALRQLRDPCVLLGVGQRLLGDDGVGPEIAARLDGRSRYQCVDAGPAPENFLGDVARRRPAAILLVDAVHFHARAGAVRLFRPEELRSTDAGTHGISPRWLLHLLADSTGAEAWMLGIQPGCCAMRPELSPACRRAVEAICRYLADPEYKLQFGARQAKAGTPSDEPGLRPQSARTGVTAAAD